MVTEILPKVKQAQLSSITPLDEVVETIYQDAMTLAQERISAPLRGLELKRLLRRPEFVDNLKYGLATGIANALAANDPRVLAVYAYDPSTNPDSDSGEDLPIDPTVRLLVLVQSSSAALEAFIASLDRGLTASVKTLPSPKFEQRTSILDVNILTEHDVKAGRGYAILLSSMFAPPLKIWQRESSG